MRKPPAGFRKAAGSGGYVGPDTSSGTIAFQRGKAYFCAGEGTLKVPMSMHKDNRTKLLTALRGRPEVKSEGAVIFLEGGSELSVYDTDTHWEFKQESNFQYLLGAKEPDCKAAIRVRDGHTVLFIPKLNREYAAWMGPIKPPAWFQGAYEVDEVQYVEDSARVVSSDLDAKSLLVLRGTNRDSGLSPRAADLTGLEQVEVTDEGCRALWEELAESRLIKSANELKVMQFVNDVTSQAHVEVMKGLGPGGNREYIAEWTFRYNSAIRGCCRVGYTCIAPTGDRNTALHYGHPGEPNSEVITPGQLTLRDMGAEYHCYGADVTCTYPVSGKFTEEQRIVYEAVWEAVLAVEHTIRPGINYKDMHRLCRRVMLERMTEAGLFQGNIDEMMQVNLMHNFMFHGLGHCLGLDVHDVGGYPPGVSRKDDPSIQENLRCGRDLKENMVITVEPGFYFTEFLMDEALKDETMAKFINKERLDQFKSVGGVRIEDDVVITATGCRVLTNVPRTVAEIEATMAGQPWNFGASTLREYSNSAL